MSCDDRGWTTTISRRAPRRRRSSARSRSGLPPRSRPACSASRRSRWKASSSGAMTGSTISPLASTVVCGICRRAPPFSRRGPAVPTVLTRQSCASCREADVLDARKLATAEFEAAFGRAPEAVAWAPGRVNLIGEHTDYNDGLVLPAALERGIMVAAAARGDGIVRALSARYGGPVEVGRSLGGQRNVELPPWAAYVRAVSREIVGAAPSGPGADLWIGGDLPSAAGLSSSAALVVACALALAEVAGVESPARNTIGFAQMVRLVEHRAGTLCGIMDPLVVLEGRRGCALRIDCRSLEIAEVPLPIDTLLVVCDSGLERALAQSAYNQRRDECEIARGALERLSGRPIRSLRDATRDDLDLLGRAFPGESYRRARHVVEENDRVDRLDRKSTRLHSSHLVISYAV